MHDRWVVQSGAGSGFPASSAAQEVTGGFGVYLDFFEGYFAIEQLVVAEPNSAHSTLSEQVFSSISAGQSRGQIGHTGPRTRRLADSDPQSLCRLTYWWTTHPAAPQWVDAPNPSGRHVELLPTGASSSATISLVSELESVSLSVAEHALRAAGLSPQRHEHAPSVAVPMPGDDAYAVVTVRLVAPGDQPLTWKRAYSAAEPGAVAGYHVVFYEADRPVSGSTHAGTADEVVATIRSWLPWQSTWSVTPVGPSAKLRLARLRRLATARLAAADLPVEIEVDPLSFAWLDAGQAAATEQLLGELFLPGIQWRFPRDRTGLRLASRARVLLRQCAPAAHPSGKGIWLVVDGPAPRGEPRLTVRLAQVFGKGAYHRWDTVPEFWHRAGRSLDQVWGIGPETSADFIDSVTELLAAGQTRQALAQCGIRLDSGTERLLAGQPSNFDLRHWTDKWVTAATDLIMRSAPWRWQHTVAAQQRPQRLENLGGFNPNRRPGLFLHSSSGVPVLTLDQKATPLVLPRVCWERDHDYDLVRSGLITREQIPLASH